MNSNLASIHGYLCGDGYVITNKNPQGHKYYYVGLRNTNIVLLEDFKQKCEKEFGVNVIITKNQDRCKIQNKELTLKLLERFGSFHSWQWKLPKMSKQNLSCWLRSYFDCDGWVGLVVGKDRKIGLESVNLKGLCKIKLILKNGFDITSSIKPHKNRTIWTLTICGKDDLQKFQQEIGFLHPHKADKLARALASYRTFTWLVPHEKRYFIDLIASKGKINVKRGQLRINSKEKSNLSAIQNKLLSLGIESRLNGPWKNPYGSTWYCLSLKLEDYKKLYGGDAYGIYTKGLSKT